MDIVLERPFVPIDRPNRPDPRRRRAYGRTLSAGPFLSGEIVGVVSDFVCGTQPGRFILYWSDLSNLKNSRPGPRTFIRDRAGYHNFPGSVLRVARRTRRYGRDSTSTRHWRS